MRDHALAGLIIDSVALVFASPDGATPIGEAQKIGVDEMLELFKEIPELVAPSMPPINERESREREEQSMA